MNAPLPMMDGVARVAGVADAAGVSATADATAATLMAADLSFAYRSRQVLKGARLQLGPGEVISLLGANGAGKSTLLRLLLGLLRPTTGEVMLSGRPIATWRRRDVARRVAYVPQVHVVPFPYSMREVVLLGRLPIGGLFRAPDRADHEVVDAVMEHLGIVHLAERPYTEVSGGERQLALIARALAQGARLLILDEPATGLDFGHQLRLLDKLSALATEDYGVLMTTHHPEHALMASTRVLLMRDGRIEADGAPRDVVTPANVQSLYDIDARLLGPAMRCWQ
jgi:iron complex transport system ATP-binding protein